MIELGLMVSLFFLLIAIIVSYLLKASLKRNGLSESFIEKTNFIAISMPSISSAKAKLILPESLPPELEKLSFKTKSYLYIVRGSFYLAVLSLIVGIITEVYIHA